MFSSADWERRFWERVRKADGDACWEWTGLTERCGYARSRRRGARVFVHRAAWEMANGPIPAGLFVCHRCDNKRCVRAGHLFIGTAQDNVDDRQAKGRQSRGSRHAAVCYRPPVLTGAAHHGAKLSSADVVTIRVAYASGGVRQEDLASHYGVDRKTVGLIVTGKNWSALRVGPIVAPGAAAERRVAMRKLRAAAIP